MLKWAASVYVLDKYVSEVLVYVLKDLVYKSDQLLYVSDQLLFISNEFKWCLQLH